MPDIELKERTGSGVSITRDSSGHTRGSMSLTQEVADSSDREYQPETIHAYDSLQSTLPAARRDGFVTRYVTRRMLLVNETYRRDKAGSLKRFSDAFVHSFPQMFFISLPAYALLLQLVYLRRRKTFYFVSHGIFGIHFYCAVFFFLFAILVLMELGMVGSILAFITFLCIPVFMYLSMKRFYRQGALKTFLKFAIVQILLSVVISALMILFVISSIFKLAA